MTSKGTIPVHLSVFMSIKTKLRSYVLRMQHRESMRDNSEYVFLLRLCANGLSFVIAFPNHLKSISEEILKYHVSDKKEVTSL